MTVLVSNPNELEIDTNAGLGEIWRRIERAFITSPGAPLTAGELVRWCDAIGV